jgi:hypothetical protein
LPVAVITAQVAEGGVVSSSTFSDQTKALLALLVLSFDHHIECERLRPSHP